MNSEKSQIESNSKKKFIKCFCNDDLICPKRDATNISKSALNDNELEAFGSLSKDDNLNSTQREKLLRFLKDNRLDMNFCKTDKVCMTKSLLKKDGTKWLKYYCDQSTPESIRNKIINYRDCRIDKTLESDRDYVFSNSPEFCCDSYSYCNIDLKPVKYVRDLYEYAPSKIDQSSSYRNNNNYQDTNNNNNFTDNGGSHVSSINDLDFQQNSNQLLNSDINTTSSHLSISPVNIILSCLSLGVFLIAVILLVFYLYKRSKINDTIVKTKPQIYQATPVTSATTSTSSSTTGVLSGSSGGVPQPPQPISVAASANIVACSPYSTTTSNSSSASTTNTSITASKENSFNNNGTTSSSMTTTTTAGDSYLKTNKLKLYNETLLRNTPHNTISLHKSDESLEPLLNINSSSNASTHGGGGTIGTVKTNEDAMKIINSPLSSTQSSGFVCSNSSQTAITTSSPSEFEWSGSGSGAGLPQCVQRTIARQIKLIYPCIGKGRFGEVYKGEWRGEHVAVKTFNSADEKSWENECNIYNTSGFRHENILGFIAADNIDRGLYTELWLITEFHANGSLYDYLTQNKITPDVAIKMALSIINGLVHLHMPIESCKGKPALAHCDLKSKNILVKSDLNCCIGDLGLALTGDKDGKLIMLGGGQIRTGTKRYMAPEILAKKIDTKYLDSFQKAEIYSLALIFWELLRSCKFEDDVTRTLYSFEYKLPYFEYLSNDPDEATMKLIVCDQMLRPSLSHLWKQNKIMNELAALTEEIWVDNPNERLNALRIKKSITKIKNKFYEQNN